MTETAQSVAERTYTAMLSRDRPALAALLADDVEAEMTAGLPFGIGGAHHGRDAMFGEVWRPAAEHFGVVAHPDEVLAIGPDRVLVLGSYVGCAGPAGRPFRAAFAHVLTVEHGRIVRWRQVTDSAAWIAALDGTGP